MQGRSLRTRAAPFGVPILLLAFAPAFALGQNPLEGLGVERFAVTPTLAEVYENLARQFADGRPAPVFQLSPHRGPPTYDSELQVISLDQTAYDIARQFGPDSLNALSYLLGHELGHFYRSHADRRDFQILFAGLEATKSLHDEKHVKEQGGIRVDTVLAREEILKFETEADFVAGFHAYLAGYEPLSLAPELLRKVYENYRLDPKLIERHPPLADRILIAQRAATLLENMIGIFEGGVHLLVIGRYAEAGRVFDHLGRSFPSREILSNAGLARTLEAVGLLGASLAWIYPLELDAETRLRGDRSVDAERKKRITKLLVEARTFFEEAKRRDPAYAPAYVNLAAVYSLVGEPELALAFATKALTIADSTSDIASGAHARIIRGIVLASTGDSAAADLEFRSGAKAAPTLAAANRAVLEGRRVEPVTADGSGEIPGPPEVIGGMTLRDGRVMTPPFRTSIAIPGIDPERPEIIVVAKRFERAEAFLVGNRFEKAFIISTPGGYTGASARGIRVGSSIADVRAEYGTATNVVAARQGSWHVYYNNLIAFSLDEDQIVRGWMIFQ